MSLFIHLRPLKKMMLRTGWRKNSSSRFQFGTLYSREKVTFIPGKSSIREENLPNFNNLSVERLLYPQVTKPWPQLSTLSYEKDSWLNEPANKEGFEIGRDLINKSCAHIIARHPGFQPILKKLAELLDQNVTDCSFWLSMNMQFVPLLTLSMLPNENMRKDETIRHEIYTWSFVFNYLVTLIFLGDDLLDSEEMSGGKACYYRLHPHTCGNDYQILYSQALYHYHVTLRRHPRYQDLFLIPTMYEMWTLLATSNDDINRVHGNSDDVEAAWEAQIRDKTSPWGLFPAAFAMIYGGEMLNNPAAFKENLKIGYELGRLGQIVDDYVELLCLESDKKLIFGDCQDGEAGNVTLGTMIALKLVRDKPELKTQLIEGLKIGRTQEGQAKVIDVFRKVGVLGEATRFLNDNICRIFGLIDEFEERYREEGYWVADLADSWRSMEELIEAPAAVFGIRQDQVPISDRAWDECSFKKDETTAHMKGIRRPELFQRLSYDLTGFDINRNDHPFLEPHSNIDKI